MSDQADDLRKFATDNDVVDDDTLKKAAQAKKPAVIVPGGKKSISESASDLFGHIAPTKQLFVRDGTVFGIKDDGGTLKLEALKPAAACSRFEDFVQFLKATKDRKGNELLAPHVLSKETAEQYLAANARFQLPRIDGLLRCPIITERAGKVHIVPSGYDAQTKLLITTQISLTEPPLRDAIELLKDLLKDYQFQTPGDRSRAIASLITPALKFGGFIKGAIPADAAEADFSQSGKTYRQHMTAAVYNDTCALVTKQESSGVGGLEEAFSTALLEGRPFIQFDNVRGKFNFQGLEAFMTAVGTFPARAAYSKVVQVDPSKFMILISSNGYQATQDLANRSSIIRIFKRPNYQFKVWAPSGVHRGGMREFVQDMQPYVLSCVFSVVREWVSRGKPRTNETRHDFRDWSQILDWIVQNLFGEAPLMDGHVEAQARVASPDKTFLRAVAIALDAKHRLNQELKAGQIFDLCQEEPIAIPGIPSDKRNDTSVATPIIGKVMTRLFAEENTIQIDAYTVSRTTKKQVSELQNPFETKHYTFSRIVPN